MIKPNHFYLLKFDKVNHDIAIERFMCNIGLKEFAFLFPTKETFYKYALALVQGEGDIELIAAKFREIGIELHPCGLEEFMQAYCLIGSDFIYVKSVHEAKRLVFN